MVLTAPCSAARLPFLLLAAALGSAALSLGPSTTRRGSGGGGALSVYSRPHDSGTRVPGHHGCWTGGLHAAVPVRAVALSGASRCDAADLLWRRDGSDVVHQVFRGIPAAGGGGTAVADGPKARAVTGRRAGIRRHGRHRDAGDSGGVPLARRAVPLFHGIAARECRPQSRLPGLPRRPVGAPLHELFRRGVSAEGTAGGNPARRCRAVRTARHGCCPGGSSCSCCCRPPFCSPRTRCLPTTWGCATSSRCCRLPTWWAAPARRGLSGRVRGDGR